MYNLAIMNNIDKLNEECKLDIIFDLDLESLNRLKLIESFGYTLVYLQTGKINYYNILKGIDVISIQFIAIKNELFQKTGITPFFYNFNNVIM